MKIEISKEKIIHFFLILFIIFLFTYSYDYSYPIEAVPDEVGQLKNVYGMLWFKTLLLPFESSYSVWTHYPYLIPTVVYWSFIYFFYNFNNFNELQLYIFDNYYQVVPFLRLTTAFYFLICFLFLKSILSKFYNNKFANIFFYLICFSFFTVINVHSAKHWIIDCSTIILSIFHYYKYLNSRKISFLILSSILFCMAVLSSYPLIVTSIFFIIISTLEIKKKRTIFFNFALYTLVFLLLLFFTIFAGIGNVANNYLELATKFQLYKSYQILINFYELNLPLAIISIVAILYFFIKNKLFILILLPSFFYIIIFGFFDAQPRYSIFLNFNLSLFSAIFLSKIKNFRLILFVLFFYIAINTFHSVLWLKIISKVDTRLDVRNFLVENQDQNNFIIYNTFGFNYLPPTKKSLSIIQDKLPRSLGDKDKYYIKNSFKEGVNGVSLWRLENSYSNEEIDNFISYLILNKFNVIFINEKFGKIAKFDQPAPDSYRYLQAKYKFIEIRSYQNYRNDNRYLNLDLLGDVLINFININYTLKNIVRPGPNITIYYVKHN
jgi:hypothetical protein